MLALFGRSLLGCSSFVQTAIIWNFLLLRRGRDFGFGVAGVGDGGWGIAKMKDEERSIWEQASSYASMSGVIE
jgi:hypothetical protein